MQGSKYNAYIYGYKYTNACVSQVNTYQSNSVSAINLKPCNGLGVSPLLNALDYISSSLLTRKINLNRVQFYATAVK